MISSTGRKLKIFTGSSHPKLGEEISQYLGVALGEIKHSHFSCGEIFVMINESIRGMNVFIIQTAGAKVNEDLMELFITIDAIKRASAKSISVVIPHYGYARQDKKALPREPISAKLMANLLTTAGATRIITMDLHADQIQGYFDIPVDHLSSMPLFERYFEHKKLKNLVVVAPDTGRAKNCKKLADRLGAEIAILHKTRPEHNKAEIMHVVGDVKGKTILLFDDMIDTAGSVTQGLKALQKHGCNDEMYLAATHAVFSGPAIERLQEAKFKEVVVTNTIPIPPEKKFEGLKVLSTAPLFAEAISRNHNNLSISEIFK